MVDRTYLAKHDIDHSAEDEAQVFKDTEGLPGAPPVPRVDDGVYFLAMTSGA